MIKNHSRTLKTFVANRVSEIQSVTNPRQWRYVPTEENPADKLTRGLTALRLAEDQSWWSGPEFLMKAENEWPKQLSNMKPDEGFSSEMKSLKKINVSMVVSNMSDEWRLEVTRFSDWMRLVRITAWVYRFYNNCIVKKSTRSSGELTVDELVQFKIIAKTQKIGFPVAYSCLNQV